MVRASVVAILTGALGCLALGVAALAADSLWHSVNNSIQDWRRGRPSPQVLADRVF